MSRVFRDSWDTRHDSDMRRETCQGKWSDRKWSLKRQRKGHALSEGPAEHLTLVASGAGRVEVSQLFLYILQHPEWVLLLRSGHAVGDAYSAYGHCRHTLDQSASPFHSLTRLKWPSEVRVGLFWQFHTLLFNSCNLNLKPKWQQTKEKNTVQYRILQLICNKYICQGLKQVSRPKIKNLPTFN